MAKKMGRPKVDNAKTVKLQVRVDEMTAERLKDYCRIHEITVSDIAREGFEIILNRDEKSI